MKPIFFTVTNDLSYDQRMHRICTSLSEAGFDVVLVGRKLKSSIPLPKKSYRQHRLTCRFNKGLLFYAEYNLRLFFFLLFKKMDGICAIDLDTILPCLFVSKLKRVKRVYDAHEFFTELKEVRTRPGVKMVWTAVEKFALPRFGLAYTVSEGLAAAFEERYGKTFAVIRNLPVLRPIEQAPTQEKFLLFQGAVNEARGFEYLVPAMKAIPYKLVICGDGNFMSQLKLLIRKHNVADRIELRGMLPPAELRPVAEQATLGLGFAEKEGVNQYYALPNKFLEYMHAGLPQVAMNFPEYQRINSEYKVAVLVNDISVTTIVDTINRVMTDEALLAQLRENALRAREVFCWQQEEKRLMNIYKSVFLA